MIQALQYGPLITSQTIYTDFNAYFEGIYEHKYGELNGSHSIEIIGYDQSLNGPNIGSSKTPGELNGAKKVTSVSSEVRTSVVSRIQPMKSFSIPMNQVLMIHHLA